MSGDKQHYMPATVIAGFGQRVAGRPRRESQILVKDLSNGSIYTSVAKDEAHKHALYRLSSPPSGLSADWVDERWTNVENALPELIQRLVDRALQPDDTEMLILYAAMMGVRHPSFDLVAADHLAKQGQSSPSSDQVNVMRIEGILNVLQKARDDWRWRVLHPANGAPHFILSDRGWFYIELEGVRSIWLPMAPTAGIIGYPDDSKWGRKRPLFEEHRDVIPSWVTWLNAVAGDYSLFTHFVFTHPNNRQLLEHLPTPSDAHVSDLGPFRGQGFMARFLYD